MISGTRIGRKACTQSTRRSGTPFTRAVVMNSWPSWSSMNERVMRAM